PVFESPAFRDLPTHKLAFTTIYVSSCCIRLYQYVSIFIDLPVFDIDGYSAFGSIFDFNMEARGAFQVDIRYTENQFHQVFVDQPRPRRGIYYLKACIIPTT